MNYTYAPILILCSYFNIKVGLLRLFFWSGQTGKSSNEPELDRCIWGFLHMVSSVYASGFNDPRTPDSPVDCCTSESLLYIYCVVFVIF